ncbi:unnamed protein product [Paramecium sonneborni]|uniref:Uncharacterized protein n=1 Tax=Paramecium sonneborni TaxID=65129 RepID=A0A8S1MUF3_9CILI|nr:unnamed protein product [Paramecium sonneborni]
MNIFLFRNFFQKAKTCSFQFYSIFKVRRMKSFVIIKQNYVFKILLCQKILIQVSFSRLGRMDYTKKQELSLEKTIQQQNFFGINKRQKDIVDGNELREQQIIETKVQPEIMRNLKQGMNQK